jgi:hypothetical protein
MSNDLSAGSFLSLAKERYASIWEDVTYKRDPFLAEVKKVANVITGKYFVQPILYGHNNAVSASIAQAVTASGSSSERASAFQIPRVKLYNAAKIDGETMMAIKGGDSSFIDATTQVLDGAVEAMAEMLGQQMFRGGWGTKGTIAAGGVSGSTITLSNLEDIWGWERDQVCVFAATESGSALRNSGGSLTVASVNRGTGVVTFTAAVSTNTGTVAGDVIFDKGNRQDSATPSPICVAGVGGWDPATDPTSALWMGADRTVDSRLMGLRWDASGMPIEEAVIKGLAYAYREGARPDRLYMNPSNYADFVVALGTRVRYVDVVGKDARVGFKGITIDGAGGDCVLMASPAVPVNRAFALTLKTWSLYYLGKQLIHIYEDDDREFIRDITGPSDAISVWFRFMGNMGCTAPSQNLNFKLA